MMKFAELIPGDWWEAIMATVPKADLRELEATVSREYESGLPIYPGQDRIFEALRLTPLAKVKAVILGQDPYPREGQAQGIVFSVPAGIRVPGSLRNILKELKDDVGIEPEGEACGDLTPWARQGVLLFNTMLTVQANHIRSHRKLGWQRLSQAVVQIVSSSCPDTAFLLWGNDAKAFRKHIRIGPGHLIMEASHPSPRSASLGFCGHKPFSSVNQHRRAGGLTEVDWRL